MFVPITYSGHRNLHALAKEEGRSADEFLEEILVAWAARLDAGKGVGKLSRIEEEEMLLGEEVALSPAGEAALRQVFTDTKDFLLALDFELVRRQMEAAL